MKTRENTFVLELLANELDKLEEQDLIIAQELAGALRNDMTLEDVAKLLHCANLDLEVVEAA